MKGLSAALLLALAAVSQDPQPPKSTFKSTVDLVPVDVSVVDRNGRPVSDLSAQDFILAVDGKPRRIASAQYIAVERATDTEAPKPLEYSSNTGAETGRLIMLVIDSENIGVGRGKKAIDAARRFIGTLNRADRVALVVLPLLGPQLEFTSNHALVQQMLTRIVGQGPETVGPKRVGITEALAMQRNDKMTIDEVITRECGADPAPLVIQSCLIQLMAEADQVINTSRFRTRNSVLALRGLFERMTAGNTPKTIVLISEGLMIDRELIDIAWVAPRAAAAQIILYVLQLDAPETEASVQRMSPSQNADRELLRQGLDQLAGMARGDVFRVLSDADFAFQRLNLELSGYYLLSFEPEAGDRDGKSHKIRIDVQRKDLQLRSRREFTVGPAAARSTDDVLREALLAPLLANDIGINLTTYTFQDPDSSKMKVFVVADVDRSTDPDQKLALGYVMMDEAGRLASSTWEPALKTPIQPERRLQKYVGAAIVPPGTYTLKLAVADETGKRGSVERTFSARISAFGQLHVTDLLIADNSVRGPSGLPPAASADFHGDQLHGYLELFSEAPEQLKNATVTIEVAETETSRTLDGTPARFQPLQPGEHRRIGEAGVPIGLLPPGSYVARAVVSVNGRKVGQVARPFRVTRTATTLTAPGAGTVAMNTTAPIPFTSRIEAFDKSTVLTPQVVGFFLDRLSPAAAASAATVKPAMDSVRAGRFDEAMEALKTSGKDEVAAAFLSGVVLLNRGDLETAAAKFREALRLDSEFLPAAFYLGACYAAGGRDREAAGAWQTSLITEASAPFVYTLLADALLRLRDMDQAIDILAEARTLWPANDDVALRLGTAFIMSNKPAEGLRILDAYLAAHPADHERLLLALRALYEARSAGRTIGTAESDKALFARYAAAYAAANGPQQALVEQWRKYIEK